MEIKMDNQKNIKKRQRSENWLEEDKNLLMDLVRERVSIIENKNTDTNTNSKKLAAWADLLSSFNCMCKGGTRSLSQLKSQWSIIKMTKKKLMSDERKKLLKTGGGPPPSTNPENADDIYSWLPNEFFIDKNDYDSDRINQINVGKPSEKKDIKVDEINKKDIIGLHGLILTIPDETPNIGTTSQVMNVIQEPLQEIENTQKVVSTGSSLFKKPSSSKKPKKKENVNKASSAAESIASVETACRKEIHEVQMANEERRARNLDLEETLLKVKIEFFRKRIQVLENGNK